MKIEQFFRKPVDFDPSCVEFQIIEWHEQDHIYKDDVSEIGRYYNIYMFGTTELGHSVACKVEGFKPYFYIKVPPNLNVQPSYIFKQIKLQCKHPKRSFYDVETFEVEKSIDIMGFRNEEMDTFIKLVFNSKSAMNWVKYKLKQPVKVNNKPVFFELYESNFEPFIRFAHLKNIKMSGHVQTTNCKIDNSLSTCQINIVVNWNNCSGIDKHQINPFLQASWDIEAYSATNQFPDPTKLSDACFQIAITFKIQGQDKLVCKHLLSLKECNVIEYDEHNVPVIVECFKTEKDLLCRFVNIISKMDPDIMYSYNGDFFDFQYIVERGKTLKCKDSILETLSRLKHIPCEMKKEVFSSTAYGDSEYNRLYVYGRLNYDLYIHMRRGNRKFPRYNLETIAQEVLNEGKNDMPIKEMFKMYKQGNPDDITLIGKYCIQDTALLQKLVDKQLILLNIIQLANVTWVPIRYLVTRGQTIKVLSQVMKKALEMNYKVPHTTFNDRNNIELELVLDKEHTIQKDDFISSKNLHILQENYVPFVYNGKVIEQFQQYQVERVPSEKSIVIKCSFEVAHPYCPPESTPLTLYDKEHNSYIFNSSITIKHKYTEFKVRNVLCDDQADEDSYTGATVLEPKTGAYFDDIVVEDFASLYPTVMIAYRLCFSTFVLDPKYDNLPNVEYETIEWKDKKNMVIKGTCEHLMIKGKNQGEPCGRTAIFKLEDGQLFCRIHDPLKKSRSDEEKKQQIDTEYSFRVAQRKNGKFVGVVPKLLEDLYTERKNVKKLMAKAAQNGDKLLESIYDGQQLAIKISLNSVYGFMGRSNGNLVLKPISMVTTHIGRNMIKQSKHYAENEFIKQRGGIYVELTYEPTNLQSTKRKLDLDKLRVITQNNE